MYLICFLTTHSWFHFIHFIVKFMNNDAVDKFIFLMKLNGKHIRKFANYLVSIWEYRKSILYTNICLFVYLGFYVAFNTVQVISRRVVGRAEETST